MSEIPEDIMKVAEELAKLCYEQPYQQVYRPLAIARAILAERERAKSVCDCWLANFGTKPIIDTPAHVYATAAVEDVRDLIVGKGA